MCVAGLPWFSRSFLFWRTTHVDCKCFLFLTKLFYHSCLLLTWTRNEWTRNGHGLPCRCCCIAVVIWLLCVAWGIHIWRAAISFMDVTRADLMASRWYHMKQGENPVTSYVDVTTLSLALSSHNVACMKFKLFSSPSPVFSCHGLSLLFFPLPARSGRYSSFFTSPFFYCSKIYSALLFSD